MSIAEIENEIIEEFELFGNDWEAKYEHIIDMGKTLPPILPELKTDDKLIKGCQSRVWLNTELNNGKVVYTADSDAIITKGIIALLIRVLNHHTPEEIAQASLSFIDKIGLKEHLSPTRANGLLNMIKQMKLDALVLNEQQKLKNS
jgi:cysteine desulfuration protein SufE